MKRSRLLASGFTALLLALAACVLAGVGVYFAWPYLNWSKRADYLPGTGGWHGFYPCSLSIFGCGSGALSGGTQAILR